MVLPRDQAAGFESLTLQVLWGAVNPTRDRVHDWVRFPANEARVELLPGAATTVASGTVPADTYKRVMVAVPEVLGHRGDGSQAIISHIEPIALPLTVPRDGSVTADLELIVLPAPRGAEGYEIFVKDAQVNDPQEE